MFRSNSNYHNSNDHNNNNNNYNRNTNNNNNNNDFSSNDSSLPTAWTTAATTIGTHFTYSIPGMEITPGPIIFTYVSELLSFITPEELPFHLIREALYANLTLIEFATNAIKVESGFIVLMSIFVVLTLVPLLATCAWCCCKERHPEDDYELNSNAPIIIDDSLKQSLSGRKRASLWTLWIVGILLALSDFSIFYANSRLSTTIEMTPEMVQSTIHDIEIFLKDTHHQIKYKLDNGFHASVEKVVKDLEDVDVLLGEPIQAEVSANTGIELAFDSLATISLANSELIYRVLMLQETVGRALKISQEAAARMEELQIQLSVLQRQCTYRDRPLCDTLRIRSFEENGLIDALKTLQEDQTIFRMRYLGEIEFGATVKNLSSEVGMSRSIFSNFPQQVKHDTAYDRNYTLEQLDHIRHRTTVNAQMLTSTITALLNRLQGAWELMLPKYNQLQNWSNTYWIIGWTTAVIIIWIILFMLMAYCCFLCESHVKAGVVFVIAVVIICLASFGLTIYGIVTLAIGGNTEIFICRPLYGDQFYQLQSYDTDGFDIDDNGNGEGGSVGVGNGASSPSSSSAPSSYTMLGKLFDKPGYVYRHEPQTGIIGELLRPAGINRSIVNVSLGKALRGCEQNRASYTVFQLDAFVNTTQIVDLKQFPKVTKAIDAIEVSERTLLSLTQTIQNILENMLQTSSFNLTTYRATIGAPTPEKDLATFIDQMQRVALQIQDVATSSRMTTLGSRSKRLQASILQPLEQLQNEILYHLTALELQRDPWAKQVNQTLNHLRNIQGYLEKTAEEICENQTRVYRKRLKAYLTGNKATMSSQLGDTTPRCRPFFDIFDANRMFLCRNIIDFMNALWFFTFLTLLLWSIGAPVGLNLITIQRRLNVLQKIHKKAADTRSRRRRRETSAARDRSTSSTGTERQRPRLQRSATEETLDVAIDDVPASQRQTPRGEREFSRTREMNVSSATPRRRRNQQHYSDNEMDDNWGSSGASRGTSYEREYNQGRNVQSRQQQRTANRPKPILQKQGTQESDIELDQWSPTNPNRQLVTRDSYSGRDDLTKQSRQERNKQKIKRNERNNFERDSQRSITPALKASPDARPAVPMPRTPPCLRSRISLTTRAVDNVLRGSRRDRKLNRSGTEEFDMDESETYGAPGSNRAAVAAASRSPPRTAPPPPPPPSMMKRRGSIRWNEGMDGIQFEDAD